MPFAAIAVRGDLAASPPPVSPPVHKLAPPRLSVPSVRKGVRLAVGGLGAAPAGTCARPCVCAPASRCVSMPSCLRVCVCACVRVRARVRTAAAGPFARARGRDRAAARARRNHQISSRDADASAKGRASVPLGARAPAQVTAAGGASAGRALWRPRRLLCAEATREAGRSGRKGGRAGRGQRAPFGAPRCGALRCDAALCRRRGALGGSEGGRQCGRDGGEAPAVRFDGGSPGDAGRCQHRLSIGWDL